MHGGGAVNETERTPSLASHKEFRTTKVCVEASSEFEVAFMVTELANILRIVLNVNSLIEDIGRQSYEFSDKDREAVEDIVLRASKR